MSHRNYHDKYNKYNNHEDVCHMCDNPDYKHQHGCVPDKHCDPHKPHKPHRKRKQYPVDTKLHSCRTLLGKTPNEEVIGITNTPTGNSIPANSATSQGAFKKTFKAGCYKITTTHHVSVNVNGRTAPVYTDVLYGAVYFTVTPTKPKYRLCGKLYRDPAQFSLNIPTDLANPGHIINLTHTTVIDEKYDFVLGYTGIFNNELGLYRAQLDTMGGMETVELLCGRIECERPDEIEPDLNVDIAQPLGLVGIGDQSILLNHWGNQTPRPYFGFDVADINKDGEVDVVDLADLLTNFNQPSMN